MCVTRADEKDPRSTDVVPVESPLLLAARAPGLLGPVYRSQRKESRSVSSWIMYSYFSFPGA